MAAPPANDVFAHAAVLEIPVGEGQTRVLGSTTEATRDPSDPQVASSSESSRTVWYRLTPTTTRRLVITTCDPATDFDTVLGLYTGTSPADLRTIARNDDDGDGDAVRTCSQGSTGYESSLVVTLEAGVTYHLMVAGWASAGGNFALRVRDDRTAPTASIASGPANGATVPAATPLVWDVASTEDGYLTCTVDGISVSNCNGRVTTGSPRHVDLDGLCDGPHTVAFTVTDMAGNVSTPLQRTVTGTGRSTCAAPERVGTFVIDDLTATTAALQHRFDIHHTPTKVWLEYGRTPAYGRTAPAGPAELWSTDMSFDVYLRLLDPGTTYYARWVASNQLGRAESVPFTFATSAGSGPAPIATLLPVTALTPTTAVLHGAVADGTDGSDYVSARFEYGTTTDYGSETPDVEGLGRMQSAPLVGLQPNTTYHYRLIAATEDQRTVTPDATFTTPSVPSDGPPPVEIPPVEIPPVEVPIVTAPAPPAPDPRKQITADLQAALRKAKSSLSRKRLRRGGTVTVAFRARTAGSVRISGALRRNRTTVANAVSGSAKAKRAGTLKLRLTVTKPGRALARKSGPERLTLKARWKPATGKTITVTRTVKLKP